MAKKRKSHTKVISSSSGTMGDNGSCDAEMPPVAPTPVRRTSENLAGAAKRGNTRTREYKEMRQMLEEIKEDTSEIRKHFKILSEIHQQVKKLTESQNELLKCLDDHIKGTICDSSGAPRPESNQAQPPRYKLKFKHDVKGPIETGKPIETDQGEMITIELQDDCNKVVKTEPLASAKVRLVVVNGEFNKDGSQYNWPKKDFMKNIIPPQKNPAMGDVNQPGDSIVSDCFLTLEGGAQSHTGARILRNSGNKKVRLGVMLLCPTEERVLEGLSNLFLVHDPKKRHKKQNVLVGIDCQEHNGATHSVENTPGQVPNQNEEIRFGTVTAPNSSVHSTNPSVSFGTRVSIPNIPAGSLTSPEEDARMVDNYHEYLGLLEDQIGTPNNAALITGPVQLLWDRPNVELRKNWNSLDQIILRHSCSPNSSLHTVQLKSNHLRSLRTSSLKDAMQTTRRNKGVLIEPLVPDGSDEERPLKRKLHNKYRLRFVNNVCEAYYTWDKIKASDGDLVKVALFDEHNLRITSGPLCSASVEVVVLQGDFNVDGQHYWSSEEFSACILCSRDRKEEPVFGGTRVLELADGEASLGDAFFQITSCHARTRKFKLGIMLASAQDEGVQEGISEPFRVRERRREGSPPGFRFQPTDEELILHYLGNRGADLSYPVHGIPEVEIFKFNPWDLPGKAVYGDRECYFFSPWDKNGSYPVAASKARPQHWNAGSGYWKDTSTDKTITSRSNHCEIGIKKAFVFYMGCAPRGTKTNWIMYSYRLIRQRSVGNSDNYSQSTSSLLQDEWVLCKIYNKQLKKQPQTSIDVDDLGQPVQCDWSVDVPTGFKFQPTDQELIVHYLHNRADNSLPCPCPVITDVDIYMFDPWNIPSKAVFGAHKYFFSPYKNRYGIIGKNRATQSGFWKVTGSDKRIDGYWNGFKKSLVFYKGRPRRATTTNWRMSEYRLADDKSVNWVLCKIFRVKTMKNDTWFATEDEPSDTQQLPHFLQGIPNGSLSIADVLQHLRSEKLPVETTPPQLRSTTEQGSGSYPATETKEWVTPKLEAVPEGFPDASTIVGPPASFS